MTPTSEGPRCPLCGAAASTVLTGPAETTVGSVTVLLERRPVLRCEAGHTGVDDEAIAAAMDAVDASVVRARRRLFRGPVCGSCGESLTMPPRRSERAVTVPAAGDRPVLTLRFALPLVRCPSCATDQLPTSGQEDLVVSVPAAFVRGGDQAGT